MKLDFTRALATHTSLTKEKRKVKKWNPWAKKAKIEVVKKEWHFPIVIRKYNHDWRRAKSESDNDTPAHLLWTHYMDVLPIGVVATVSIPAGTYIARADGVLVELDELKQKHRRAERRDRNFFGVRLNSEYGLNCNEAKTPVKHIRDDEYGNVEIEVVPFKRLYRTEGGARVRLNAQVLVRTICRIQRGDPIICKYEDAKRVLVHHGAQPRTRNRK